MNAGPHEIHVWLAFDRDIAGPHALVLERLLTPDETARRDKLHFEHDRRQFLVTRALQRLVLSEYASAVAPRDWRFAAGERGKPALTAEFAAHGLHFNLAHTPGLVAFAVSKLPGLGVDAENSRTRTAPLHLAKRYFTDAEVRALDALPPDERPARFFALWTLKESWLKATGQGLAAGLGNASFELDETHRLRRVEFLTDDAGRWRFWQFAPSSDHVLALGLLSASTPPAVTVAFKNFPADLTGTRKF